MSDLEQARELAGAAERDISALHGMGDSAIFADEIFGFHVQQAAEKLLKAWLASRAAPCVVQIRGGDMVLERDQAGIRSLARLSGRYGRGRDRSSPATRPGGLGQWQSLESASVRQAFGASR